MLRCTLRGSCFQVAVSVEVAQSAVKVRPLRAVIWMGPPAAREWFRSVPSEANEAAWADSPRQSGALPRSPAWSEVVVIAALRPTLYAGRITAGRQVYAQCCRGQL
jgi:hypothetical protein